MEPLKPEYDWDKRNRYAIIATWYSGTSETRLRLGPNNSVCYYNYTIQWNLWNPTTAGTKGIGLLYLHDTVEPLKPDYRWDQRNRSVIIATWYSGTSETGLQLESKKLVCYYIYMIQWNLWTRLRLGSKKSVGYYSYMTQWNLWNSTTAGTNEIGLLL